MIKWIISITLCITFSITNAQNVAINNNNQPPNESALLHVESNSKGIIIPRMNSIQRQNISNPVTGLMVYDITTDGFWYYKNNSWIELLNEDRFQNIYVDGDSIKITEGNSSVAINNLSYWDKTGDNLHRTIGNVGINTLDPISALHVEEVLQVSGVFGSGDSLISPGNVPRMFFYPRKGAFRAGGVFADQWDEPNLGDYSTSMGFSNSAKGTSSVSLGYFNDADGDYSVAMGRTSNAQQDYDVAIGHSVSTYSPYETALGSWNTSYTPASSILWDPNDRLFIVGNGIDNSNRSDALTILKNGNIGFGTSTPQADLEILGSESNSDAILFDDGRASRHSSDLLRTDRQWVNLLIDADNSQNSAHFALYNDSVTSNGIPVVKFQLDGGNSWINSGNVGIGTISPTTLLQVAGDTKIDGTTFNVDAVNNRVGVGTSTPETKLHVAGSVKVDGPTFNVDAINNRIGVGTSTPEAKMHVVGSMKVDGSTFNVDAINNRIGIGTTSPSADVHILGAAGTDALIWDSGNASLVHGQDLIRTKRDFINLLFDTDNNGSNARLRLFNDITANAGTPPISFGLDGNSWITSGNLGIGTTSPSADLELVGTPDSAAIVLDNGHIELRHGEDFIVTDNKNLNILVDANNNNTDSAIGLYVDDESSQSDPYHKFAFGYESKSYFYGGPGSNGYLGINTDDPLSTLHVDGNFRVEGKIRLDGFFGWYRFSPELYVLELRSEDGGGLIGEFDAITGDYSSVSDARFKRNISPLRGALSKVKALNPKTYQFKSEEEDAPYSIGFLAQEVEDILPGSVNYNVNEDKYTMNYSSFGVLAIQAIKEQQEKIVSLEERIATLENALFKLIDK